MGFLLGWASILLGAVSLFSLMEKLGNFRLAPVFQEVLNLHRSTLYPVGEAIIFGLRRLLSIININLIPILPDVAIIYILFSLAIVRFAFTKVDQWRNNLGRLAEGISLLLLAFVWPLIFIMNVMALFISPKLGVRDIFLGWDVELSKILGAFFILFCTNFVVM